MEIDVELEVWRREWQSDPPVLPDLRKKVERQSFFMKIGLIADVLVTVVIGGGAIVWALRSPRRDILLLAVGTWTYIAAAWAVTVTLNRGNWRPSALTSTAFVDLSIRRCRARLAAIRFGAGLFVAQITFVLSWVYQHEQHLSLWDWLFFSSLPIDLVWLATLLFFTFLIWYKKRKQTELAYFTQLSVDGGPPGPQPARSPARN